MTRNLLRAGALSCALLTTTAFCTQPALAQDQAKANVSPPPENFVVSPGGVDMRSGRYAYSQTDLSIGSEAGGLTLTRTLAQPVAGHNNPFANFSHGLDILVSENAKPRSVAGADWGRDWEAAIGLGVSLGVRILAAGLAIGLAAPAAGQIAGRRDYGPVAPANPFLPDSRPPAPSPGREVEDLRGRIAAARESGDIGRREARRLDREARLIGRLAARYGRDGLSAPERGEIATRAAAVRGEIAARTAVNRPRR